MQSSHKDWISNLFLKSTNPTIEITAAPLQDQTRPVLENLLQQGYTHVEWDAGRSMHAACRELHHQKWLLQDFISNLKHDAPMFEKSHPGDNNCVIVVSGPNLESVRMDYTGQTV